MGFLDKIMFWKKNEPDLSTNFSSDNLGLDKDNDFLKTGGLNTNDDHSNNLGLESSKDPALDKPLDDPFSTSLKDRSLEKSAMEKDNKSSYTGDRELELISSKLDTIKAELDAMSQRLQKIERTLDLEEKEKKRPLW